MSERMGAPEILGYLKEKKTLAIIIFIAAVGICLMLFGTGTHTLTSADTEKRVEALCEQIDGVTDASVMIMNGADGNVRGVAIVCTGGDDANTKLLLTELICALFGIPSSSVSVVPGK